MQPETPIAAYRAARAAADQSFQQNRRPYLYLRRHTAAADALAGRRPRALRRTLLVRSARTVAATIVAGERRVAP